MFGCFFERHFSTFVVDLSPFQNFSNYFPNFSLLSSSNLRFHLDSLLSLLFAIYHLNQGLSKLEFEGLLRARNCLNVKIWINSGINIYFHRFTEVRDHMLVFACREIKVFSETIEKESETYFAVGVTRDKQI